MGSVIIVLFRAFLLLGLNGLGLEVEIIVKLAFIS